MDDSGYKVVFDIAQTGFKAWTFPAFGLIFVILGIFVIPILQRMSRRSSGPFFQVFFVGFALLWTGSALFTTLREYLHIRHALEGGSALVVTGAVVDFHPMPITGHAMETFSVGGVPFSYSDYVVTSGFNQTESHGGPIHAGEQIRIWYVPERSSNVIVKLAIKE
jgi:hypothetical protein